MKTRTFLVDADEFSKIYQAEKSNTKIKIAIGDRKILSRCVEFDAIGSEMALDEFEQVHQIAGDRRGNR